MLDLDNPEVVLPPYRLKVDGKEKEYDSLLIGFKLRALFEGKGEEDPEKIRDIIQEVLGIEKSLSTFEACYILSDFKEFTVNTAEEPLKKVFGRSLFSDTTTDSAPEKSVS